MWLLSSSQTLQPLKALLKYSVSGACAQTSVLCVCVCCGLGLLLSLAVSLHLSHDFPDLNSPGVSHLGHQLHLQVNCSSKWSAKQYKKKKKNRKKHHHSARITSAWQDQTKKLAINKPMSCVRHLLKHFKRMRMSRICKKERETETCCMFASSVPPWILKWMQPGCFSFFSLAALQWRKQSCQGKLTGEPCTQAP